MNDTKATPAATPAPSRLVGELCRWLEGGAEDDRLALLVALELARGEGDEETAEALRSALAGPLHAHGAGGG